MGKQRLFFADALKAFAILSVVIGHLALYSFWRNDGEHAVLATFVSLYHMPLFMMISGYVTNYEYFLLKGRLKLLIPFFLLGTLYAAFCGLPLSEFLIQEAKYGYWFLWAIAIFFTLLCIIRRLGIRLPIGIIGVELIFVALHAAFRGTEIGTTFSTDHLWFLWPSFALGIVLRRGLFCWMEQRAWFTIGLCLLLIVVLGTAIYFNHSVSIFKALNFLISFPICIMLFVVFHKAEEKLKGVSFTGKRVLKSMGTNIGTQTLQIYTLHSFFIHVLDLHFVGDFMEVHQCYWMEFFVSPLLAIIISYLCIYIAKWMYKLRLGFVFGR